MNPIKTTPVPNVLFDMLLKDLKGSELKILLVIIRQTLGWVDQQKGGGRKIRDWISTSQLEGKTGSSRRSISSGLAGLVQQGLIRITEEGGFELQDAALRKGKMKLYYELSIPGLTTVEKMCKTGSNPCIKATANAEIAQDMSKKVHDLAQKLHITKQTLQN